jgi:hypothetical protein
MDARPMDEAPFLTDYAEREDASSSLVYCRFDLEELSPEIPFRRKSRPSQVATDLEEGPISVH